MEILKKYMLLCVVLLTTGACKEDYEYPLGGGKPSLKIEEVPSEAFFGDSTSFKVSVADDGTDLSTVKAQLFFSGVQVSETVIRTKTYGTYEGKIFVPFYKEIPDGVAELRFVLENVGMVQVVEKADLSLSRPDFPYLELVTNEQTYRLERVEKFKYAATNGFPQKLNGYIQAPAYGDHGNVIYFGWENKTIKEGSKQLIPFSYLATGDYTVNFNTLTYAAEPFQNYAVNGVEMSMQDDTHYVVDVSLTKDEEIVFSDIPEVDSWWTDIDFIRKENGKYFFNAQSGKYRFTADMDRKYFIVEAMDGNELATLKDDGTGALWVIGEGVGKPNLQNEVSWTTEKGLCMAPIGDKKYRMTLVAGQTVKASSINFKFFHQKGWGGEFGSDGLSTNSDLIYVGNGSNGRDSGNLGIIDGKQLVEGATYVFTMDLSGGKDKAVLTVERQ